MEDNSIFCPSCGQKVGAEPVTATAPPFGSAFRPAGSLGGCDSGLSAPVVDQKPAEYFAPQPVYPYTQANGPSVAAKMASPAPKKRSVWKYVCAGILAVLVVLVSVFFITKAQAPWFKVNSAGKLFFDEGVWEFYNFNSNYNIEIPKKYDGVIEKISDDDSLQYYTLQYDGSLEEFIEEHFWAIQMMKDHGRGAVVCRDYVLSYHYYYSGSDEKHLLWSDDGLAYLVDAGCYWVGKELGGKDISFESMGQMLRWLDTGIYEGYYTNPMLDEPYYYEIKITLD